MNHYNVFLAGALTLLAAICPAWADSSSPSKPSNTTARLVIDAPASGALVQNVAIIQFHAENVKIAPAYGQAAIALMPAVGHLHVTVDGNAWHWVHSSGEPVVIQGLAPGQHTVELVLADALHRPLDKQTRSFSVAAPAQGDGHAH
jgi:hypothetical protein